MEAHCLWEACGISIIGFNITSSRQQAGQVQLPKHFLIAPSPLLVVTGV